MNNEYNDWELLMKEFKEEVFKKYGRGYQKKLHDEFGINRNRLSRFFNLRNPPRLDTLMLLSKATQIEIKIIKKNRNVRVYKKRAKNKS